MSQTIQLVEVIIGMGDPVHTHVRRHNEINPDSRTLDVLVNQQSTGGIVPSTLNEFSLLSGGMTTSSQGEILLSDGWNTKRGLGMFRFIVSSNALQQEELAILGYLTGGECSAGGIEENTMFVPVRSWSVLISDRQDLSTGLPYIQQTINDSQQFLLSTEADLFSLRPKDVIDNVGILTVREDHGIGIESFDGTTTQNLSPNGVIMSKTKNLDPTFFAQSILGPTIKAVAESSEYNGDRDTLTTAMLESVLHPSLVETTPLENAFFRTMMANLGSTTLTGFNGYTFGEINSVFENLPDVLNLEMLSRSFEDPNWLMMSHEYGASNYAERIACEIATLAVHALSTCGLSSVEFLASNNVAEIGGINSENGLAYQMGAAMPLLQNENNLMGRVESFKDALSRGFFARYRSDVRGGFSVGIRAKCYMFGETSVTVVIDGKPESERTYANATYMINQTSSNVVSGRNAVNSSITMLNNIENYLGLN